MTTRRPRRHGGRIDARREGAWRIVPQAWHKVTPSNPIPEDLVAGTG
jgi:hypothetical protein